MLLEIRIIVPQLNQDGAGRRWWFINEWHRLLLALCTLERRVQDLVPLLLLQIRDDGGEVGCGIDINGVAFACLNMVPPVRL